MKILGIGFAGYVGSVLTQYYLEKGHEVVCLDLLRRGSDGIRHHLKNPNFTLINADYMEGLLDSVLTLHEPEIVIHLAAIVGDPACAREPELATRTNVEGIPELVKACNERDLKLFVASTCSVYGSNPNTCSELLNLNPLSHYARTKLQMEKIIRESSENGICFRFGTMHGWSPNMRCDIIVNRLVRDALKLGQFKIFDGKQYRPFLHPLDLAMFFESLFDKNLESFTGEVFNLVSENYSMLELGQLIERVIPTALMVQIPEKEDDRSYICSSFKAHSRLGFQPKMRILDSIQEIKKKIMGEKQSISSRAISGLARNS